MIDGRDQTGSAIGLPWAPVLPDATIDQEPQYRQMLGIFATSGAPAPAPQENPLSRYNQTHTRLGLKMAVISGGAAGDHTVTGIEYGDGKRSYLGDQLIGVLHYTPGAASTIADLTSEFTLTADNTINNTGGTATTGDTLIVFYVDMDA